MKSSFVSQVFFGMLVLILMTARFCSAAETIELDGVIEPHLIVKIGSPVAGVLETVSVDRGDVIKKGQVVAKLQSGIERAALELARARAGMDSTIKAREVMSEFNLRKLKRFEDLEKSSVIPFEEIDEARTNANISLLELDEAKENKRLAELELRRSKEVVERMTIYSPINGVVMHRFLTAGEYVENQPIVQLAQIDPLNVEVFAQVDLLDTIKVGMSADIMPIKPGSEVYKAKVTIVDYVVDAASGTFGIRLELPNPDYRLSAGLKCKVIFFGP